MYLFSSKVLGAAAPKPPLIQFGYALISVLMRLTFTFGATFRHEEMLKVCPLKCKLAPFCYSENKCGSNDISLQFVEFSNVQNCDRSSNATLSNLAYKIV